VPNVKTHICGSSGVARCKPNYPRSSLSAEIKDPKSAVAGHPYDLARPLHDNVAHQAGEGLIKQLVGLELPCFPNTAEEQCGAILYYRTFPA
jgi:hypothetical protein